MFNRTFALFLCLVVSSTTFAQSVSAPVSECNAACDPDLPALPIACLFQVSGVQNFTWTCTRNDAGRTWVSAGQEQTYLGQSMNCENCTDCPCPGPAGAQPCEQELDVDWNGDSTLAFGADPSVNVPPSIQEKLEEVFAKPVNTEFSGFISCGPEGGQPRCTKAVYSAALTIYVGAKVQISSTYTFTRTLTTSPPGCTLAAGSTASYTCPSAVIYHLTGSRHVGEMWCHVGTQENCPRSE